MKQIIAVPCDSSDKNRIFYEQFEKSLRHFHPDIELRRFDNPNPNDTDFWYRATPVIANKLFEEGYERIIKCDVDQIVLGSLDEIINDVGDYDVGVVLNDPNYPIQVWDMKWPYFNNGLVVMQSKEFVKHWERLCFTNHFPNYQYREQDFLNMLCSDYFNYRSKILDDNKVYGEWAKPYWAQTSMEDGKVMLPTTDKPRQLCMYHSGGGNEPGKGNFRIRFPEEVVKYIDSLIK